MTQHCQCLSIVCCRQITNIAAISYTAPASLIDFEDTDHFTCPVRGPVLWSRFGFIQPIFHALSRYAQLPLGGFKELIAAQISNGGCKLLYLFRVNLNGKIGVSHLDGRSTIGTERLLPSICCRKATQVWIH